MSISRPWLALVIALLCSPLFVDLGREDLQNDEAIYSFAVDRILETGDWLEPKSSPNDDWAFLEKPPLKFWLVAAPIRAGLLPHTEFGLRFWDALFGAVALIYVFALGSRLAGPICGAVAALLLFVHGPLVFDHGFRSNNMEAALFLSYCAGVYHFLEWVRLEADRDRSDSRRVRLRADPSQRHAIAVGLYFVLGFMTKFAAAIFLPLVLIVASLLVSSSRTKLVREWRVWAKVSLMVLVLCAPWFVYAHLRYGTFLWQTIIGEHLYRRFTESLDPMHVQPWFFYLQQMYLRFGEAGSAVLVGAGLAVLLVQTILRRWPEGAVILLWLALPVTVLSFGTSKIYHYIFPFLPPLALAGGYLIALLVALAPVPFSRAVLALDDYANNRVPRLISVARRAPLRSLFLTVAVVAIGLAVVTLIFGPVRINVAGREVFRSSGVFRPALVAIVFGMLAGADRVASHATATLLVASLLPLPAYRSTLSRLDEGRRPLSSALECIQRVQTRDGRSPGVYVDLPDEANYHPMHYYFRRLRPWLRAESPNPALLQKYLYDPSELRPTLVAESTYQQFRHVSDATGRPHPVSPAMIRMYEFLLLLPGPYGLCGAEAADPRAIP